LNKLVVAKVCREGIGRIIQVCNADTKIVLKNKRLVKTASVQTLRKGKQ